MGDAQKRDLRTSVFGVPRWTNFLPLARSRPCCAYPQRLCHDGVTEATARPGSSLRPVCLAMKLTPSPPGARLSAMAVSKTDSGRWRVRIKDGRRDVASKTFDRKADAEAWESAQRRSLVLGDWIDPRAGREALRGALVRWMDGRAGLVASSTLKADRGRLAYLSPALGNLPVNAVRPSDVQTLLDALSRRGLSPASVTRVRALLSSFYGWARREGMTATNPVASTRVSAGEATKARAEVYPFSVDELREVVAELRERSPQQADIALVLGLTGLRWGELAALRVRDVITVPHPALHVTRSAPDGHEIRNRTKGGRGRSVPLVAEILPIVQRRAEGRGADELIFVTPEGHRLNNSNWRGVVGWAKSCRGRRIHDLRHTAATLWLANGIDVKTVQTWLGHESAQLTLNLYSHWMGSHADAAAVARLNALLGGTSGGQTEKPESRAGTKPQ